MNHYYTRGRRGVFISDEGIAYKLGVGLRINQIVDEPIGGEIAIAVRIYRKRKSGDLDNYLKALLDACNKLAWVDDKYIVEIHARRFDDKRDPRAEIDIWRA